MNSVNYLLYIAACTAVIVVPGPSVTVIIANSLRSGTRAGLANVAGTQAGLLVMLGTLAIGLSAIVSAMAIWFDVLRLVGAAYLVYLGVKMWRGTGTLPPQASAPAAKGSYFWQGVLVIWTNPKALLFFGAFIPQFIDPTENTLQQVLVLGLTFMLLATFLDSAYAIAAGKMGRLLASRNVRILERLSGSCLITSGIWLALSRR